MQSSKAEGAFVRRFSVHFVPMLAELDTMECEALAELAAVSDAVALEAYRVRWLGTNGRLRGAMDALKTVPKESKPAVGKRLNEVKAAIEAAFN